MAGYSTLVLPLGLDWSGQSSKSDRLANRSEGVGYAINKFGPGRRYGVTTRAGTHN